jgi:hypothetical protein
MLFFDRFPFGCEREKGACVKSLDPHAFVTPSHTFTLGSAGFGPSSRWPTAFDCPVVTITIGRVSIWLNNATALETVLNAVEVEVLNEATELSTALKLVEVEVLNEATELSTALKLVEVEVLNEATELSTALKLVEVEVLNEATELSTALKLVEVEVLNEATELLTPFKPSASSLPRISASICSNVLPAFPSSASHCSYTDLPPPVGAAFKIA